MLSNLACSIHRTNNPTHYAQNVWPCRAFYTTPAELAQCWPDLVPPEWAVAWFNYSGIALAMRDDGLLFAKHQNNTWLLWDRMTQVEE